MWNNKRVIYRTSKDLDSPVKPWNDIVKECWYWKDIGNKIMVCN